MEQSTVNSQEALEVVLYKFLSLHDALEKQQFLLQQQNDELIKQVTLFTEQVGQFKALEPAVRQQVTTAIQQAVRSVGAAMTEAAGSAASKSVEQTVQKLQRASEHAQHVLASTQLQSQNRFWRELVIGIACSVVASLAAVWLLMPKPMLALSKEDMDIYQHGLKISQLMQQLPAQEKQKVWNILERKHRNRSTS